MLQPYKVMLTTREQYAIMVQTIRITIFDEKFPKVELTAYFGWVNGKEAKE